MSSGGGKTLKKAWARDLRKFIIAESATLFTNFMQILGGGGQHSPPADAYQALHDGTLTGWMRPQPALQTAARHPQRAFLQGQEEPPAFTPPRGLKAERAGSGLLRRPACPEGRGIGDPAQVDRARVAPATTSVERVSPATRQGALAALQKLLVCCSNACATYSNVTF